MEEDQLRIPKIIHYCWFGRAEKGERIQSYIKGWKKILPDYQIIEWNEDNFDINCNTYVKEAYEHRKYAFVSDVARVYALNEYGGIYLDTDVEIRQSLTPFLNHKMILAYESESLLMTGFMAASKKNPNIKQLLDSYEHRKFVQQDGTLNMTANTVYLTNMMKEKGLSYSADIQVLNDGTAIYPLNIFGAFDADNSSFVITPETVLVHWCMASWSNTSFRILFRMKRMLSSILGRRRYEKIRLWLKKC